MTETPLSLKTLEGALEEAALIPLWGTPPPFPWDALSKSLAQCFDKKTFSLSAQKTDWLEKEEFLSGMGSASACLTFSLSPLPGVYHFVLPREGQTKLLELLLTEESSSKGFTDEALNQGFFHFAFVSALDAFNRESPYGDLTACLAEENPLPEERALCIDVSLDIDGHPLMGRLICPRETQAAFRTHFAMEKPPLLSDPSFADTPIPLLLEVGQTQIPIDKWKQVKQGDFILLDRCTYDIENKRGRASLVLGKTRLFDVRIKEGEVKILEQAHYQEETPMTDQVPPEQPSDENDSTMEEKMSEERPMWSPPNGEEEEAPIIPVGDVPLTLTVEVGRLKMPLDKLSQLEPGNLLNLDVQPESGVYLTVEGKRIAKGELVKVGELLGVKILTLGG
ncbi:MAG: Flagellar motor switch protein FliN [Chlamydiae bacterium]|nr:Flagellar motor switch protein FliN [Chlamydiota bacterium]